MIEFKKSDYDNLKPYRKHLSTAYYAKYLSALTTDEAAFLFDYYNRLFNKKETTKSCSACRIRVVGLLGRYFFEYENKINEKLAKAREAKKNKGANNEGNT